MILPFEDTLGGIEARVHEQARRDALRITLHAHQEMVEDDVTYAELREVLLVGSIIENYSAHKRGACCLISGCGPKGYVHVVCTTSLDPVVIITVYHPQPPKWITPTKRGGLS